MSMTRHYCNLFQILMVDVCHWALDNDTLGNLNLFIAARNLLTEMLQQYIQ